MRHRRFRAALLGVVTLLAVASAAASPRDVTLHHRPTGFSVSAPAGFTLSFVRGVYVLRHGAVTIGFSRTETPVTPASYGDALIAQLGGQTISRHASGTRYAAEVAVGARRETVLVHRAGALLVVTTGSGPPASPVSIGTLTRVGRSAHGGVALRANLAASSRIPLVPYRNPDGSATALVPGEAGWSVTGGNGLIQGGKQGVGSFLLGLSETILLPQNAPANPPASMLISPYMSAADALRTILPRIAPSVSGVRITAVLRDAALPTYTSSGMVRFTFQSRGRPWTGVATIGTDSPAKYGNFSWVMYYSGVTVPVGTDGSVGQALLQVWHSWNPGAAIAARTQASLDLIDQTNSIWRNVSEFSSVTRDRQARDVGCLLEGYYAIEDNARAYNLPSAPCGQVYVPANG